MQALRHQAGREPQTFDVLAKNKDGTVELGRDGVLVIGNCIVSDDGKPGTCTLIKPGKSKGEKPAKPDAKALADAKAALADLEARFAADPTNEELGKQVDAAREALAALAE